MNKKISILCVEDGSVDLDELEESGLQDGKILVYRQGATPPYVLTMETDIVVNKVVNTEVNYGLKTCGKSANARKYLLEQASKLSGIESHTLCVFCEYLLWQRRSKNENI